MAMPKDPAIFVALDVDDPKRAEALAEKLSGHGFGFKLGPRLMLREGAGLVRSIARHGDVFVDCKHLDIPTTMVAAVRAYVRVVRTISAAMIHLGVCLNSTDPGKMLNLIPRAPS